MIQGTITLRTPQGHILLKVNAWVWALDMFFTASQRQAVSLIPKNLHECTLEIDGQEVEKPAHLFDKEEK